MILVSNVEKEEVVEGKNETPEWESEGYASYNEWLADTTLVEAEITDDLSVGLNTSMSQHRISSVLDEYSKTSEHDIAEYDPESDIPVSVISGDLDYVNHTVDNIKVDSDPTQIATVRTAVEDDIVGSRKSNNLDISDFIHTSDSDMVDDLIQDDIDNMYTSSKDSQEVVLKRELGVEEDKDTDKAVKEEEVNYNDISSMDIDSI